METKTLTRTWKAFVTLAMLQSPVSFEAQAARAPKGSKCQPVNQCSDAVDTAKKNAGMATLFANSQNSGGQSGGGDTMQNASTGTASAACRAQSQCNTLAEKCEPKKNGCEQEDCDKVKQMAAAAGAECQQAAGAAGAAGDTKQAASGGGDGSALAAMAPLAMAAAMMAMQNKKKEEEPKPDPNSAWNGVQLDCSKPDAHLFQACNGQMEQKCAAMMDDPTCVMFEARYCVGQTGTDVSGNTAAVLAATPQVDPATGMVMGVPVMGQPSEGVGTQFCANHTAYNFCKGAGRENCPSCQRLQANASAICAKNPADCLQGNSAAVMQQAAQTCPTDPAFANPNWAANTGNSGVPSTMSGIGGGGGGTILPQSVGGKASTNTMNGASTASAGTGALQEGRATGSAAGLPAGGGSASSNGPSFGVVPGSSRELASSANSFRTSSFNEAPASDVQARNSQNLFQTGSQVIRYRCETGRLNCP